MAVLFVWNGNAIAQLGPTDDHLDSDFLQPQIIAGYSAASPREFQGTDGSFATGSMMIGGVFPLYRDEADSRGGATTYFVLGRARMTTLNEDISFLASPHSVYNPRLGLTGGIATTNHHLYLLTIGGGFSEDENAVTKPVFRPNGSLLGKYQLDESFAFIYGLSYSYAFDRGLLLPMLGVHTSLGKSFALHVVLPFSFNVEYVDTPDLHFGLAVRASGDQIHVNENDFAASQNSPLYLKIAQVQSGISVTANISGPLWIQGEAGILTSRRFAIGTLKEDLLTTDIRNGGYSSLQLIYRFGHFESWGD
jgi:Domain of unknown function (DUF6268)